MKNEWFATWFDSPYYHLLYKNHDEDEAEAAIDNLLQALRLPAGARVLDLACGRGRHARHLAELGFDVTGLDISPTSIEYARQFEQEGLAFYQHDMRRPFRSQYFDAIVNFFTSFGYFERERDNLLTLKNVSTNLRPNGLFLLDYFNSNWVRQNLVAAEEKMVEGIRFQLKRSTENGHVKKTIDFDAEGRHFTFQERVRLFSLSDFETLFAAAGLSIQQTYGDYDLRPFDPTTAKRLILIAKKITAA